MELKEMKKKSIKILADFIDEIGLDGDYYVETNCKAPMVYIDDLEDAAGEYITPKSARYEEALQKIDQQQLAGEDIENIGFIVINDEYMNWEPESEDYVTIIHEILHSNRNLLLHGAYEYTGNPAISYSNGNYEQTISEPTDTFGDASQNVLKASIDNSRKTVSKHAHSLIRKILGIKDLRSQGKVKEQFARQKILDEALVELMSCLAYKRNSQKEKNENEDIWSTIEGFRDVFKYMYKEKHDRKHLHKSVMCEIILKHHDFELFNWMLDPISYSAGDINYDFFADYTKNDGDLVKKLYGQEKDEREDTFITSLQGSVKSEPDSSEMVSNKGNSRQITEKSIDDNN